MDRSELKVQLMKRPRWEAPLHVLNFLFWIVFGLAFTQSFSAVNLVFGAIMIVIHVAITGAADRRLRSRLSAQQGSQSGA